MLCKVLNLVISGIPSILQGLCYTQYLYLRFKPCYKWNTFNTLKLSNSNNDLDRGFKPCYKWNTFNTVEFKNGLKKLVSFKPCYKWNTFNT